MNCVHVLSIKFSNFSRLSRVYRKSKDTRVYRKSKDIGVEEWVSVKGLLFALSLSKATMSFISHYSIHCAGLELYIVNFWSFIVLSLDSSLLYLQMDFECPRPRVRVVLVTFCRIVYKCLTNTQRQDVWSPFRDFCCSDKCYRGPCMSCVLSRRPLNTVDIRLVIFALYVTYQTF